MMRKTKFITLTMLAGTALTLGGCFDDESKPKFVKDEKECMEKYGDKEACDKAMLQAKEDHEKTAPKFANQQSCEEFAGSTQCYQKSDNAGHSWFVPFMTGYFISRMLNSGGDSYYYRSQSACRDRYGNMYANGCGPIGSGYAFYRPYSYTGSSFAGTYKNSSFTPTESFTNSWTSSKIATSRGFTTSSTGRGGFGGSAGARGGVSE